MGKDKGTSGCWGMKHIDCIRAGCWQAGEGGSGPLCQSQVVEQHMCPGDIQRWARCESAVMSPHHHLRRFWSRGRSGQAARGTLLAGIEGVRQREREREREREKAAGREKGRERGEERVTEKNRLWGERAEVGGVNRDRAKASCLLTIWKSSAEWHCAAQTFARKEKKICRRNAWGVSVRVQHNGLIWCYITVTSSL